MDLLSAVAVSMLPGISRPRAFTAWNALRLDGETDAGLLESVARFCEPAADSSILIARALRDAAGLIAAAEASRIEAVTFDAESYPPLLRTVPDAPPVLWVRGQADVLPRPAVAIVGSRAATPYALEIGMRLGRELAERGLVVASGLARGVDASAHRGCLDGGGPTIAVLGSGPDVVYPAEHAELAASISKNGVLVSELGPGAPPLPEHFPLRNRLISGISLAVVVVEASERSGSLITARYAAEQGRDVMAVPGSVLSGRNRGSHALLKDGAKVVERADDILEELGWTGCGAISASRAAPEPEMDPKISDKMLKTDSLLMRLTPGECYDLDEMSATVGLAGPKLLPRLTDWEMRGQIVRVAGGRYMLGREQ